MRVEAGPPSRLEPAHIASPLQFWDEHVVCRKPALFSALSPDLAHLQELWTDAHLIGEAGSSTLKVEQRASSHTGFGKGPDTRVPLTFAQVLERTAAGDATLYLTTQDVPPSPDGHPALYASPIAELAGDVPLVPAVMGRLVPQSINMWLGAARDGSSTGLHTDFHDNLYVLLRGRKRFRLYPPQSAKRMYTVGRVQAVHPNGRIVFKGQGDILPDGSEAAEVARWQARHGAEAELAAAEEDVRQGKPGAAKRLRAAERRLDAVLDAALGEDEWGDMVDDFDAMEAPPPAPPAAAGDPVSFSRIDLNLPDAQLKKSFPLFPGKAAALECEVEAGQMLYLPAGWFHEVTSFSTAACPTHMALNFWYHPPDNLAAGTQAAMKQPYLRGFWPAVWEGRRRQYEARHWRGEQQRQLSQAALQVEQQQRQHSQGAGQLEQQPEGQPEEQQQQQQQQSTAASVQTTIAATVPAEVELRRSARRKTLLAHTFGLFGVGRRQHLHAFVGVAPRKRKAA